MPADRARSRSAYANLTGVDALDLARARFADELTAPLQAPTPDQLGGRIVARRGTHDLVVEQEAGRRVLVRSTGPATVETATGAKRSVDLRLVETDDGWRPRQPVRSTVIADDLGGGVRLDGGISVRLVGANEASAPIERSDRVVFSDALTDTDLAIKPRTTGAEHLLHVRSAAAPEDFVFRLCLG